MWRSLITPSIVEWVGNNALYCGWVRRLQPALNITSVSPAPPTAVPQTISLSIYLSTETTDDYTRQRRHATARTMNDDGNRPTLRDKLRKDFLSFHRHPFVHPSRGSRAERRPVASLVVGRAEKGRHTGRPEKSKHS